MTDDERSLLLTLAAGVASLLEEEAAVWRETDQQVREIRDLINRIRFNKTTDL